MNFQQMMADDATRVFCNPDDFAEAVTVTTPGGTARAINVLINRSPPERVDRMGNLVTPRMTMLVANHATLGIASATLDAYGATKVRVAYRPGDTEAEYGVYLPDGAGEFMDGAMMTLDLR